MRRRRAVATAVILAIATKDVAMDGAEPALEEDEEGRRRPLRPALIGWLVTLAPSLTDSTWYSTQSAPMYAATSEYDDHPEPRMSFVRPRLNTAATWPDDGARRASSSGRLAHS